MAPLLELIDVRKGYERLGVEGDVLRGVNLRLERGEALAITGPSGSGKSTLLNIIGGLDRPTSGRVLLDGRDLAQLGDNELARVRNRSIGFVFQDHHLLPQCTALENVLIPALVNGRAGDAAARGSALLDQVGLGRRRGHRPAELSGGERQRVALVRALINEPSLLLADEPTGSLDAHSAEELSAVLIELNRDRALTLITVTHAPLLARRMGRALELRDGALVETRP